VAPGRIQNKLKTIPSGIKKTHSPLLPLQAQRKATAH
jgi:hypothetical protein